MYEVLEVGAAAVRPMHHVMPVNPQIWDQGENSITPHWRSTVFP
jgi:hypothetical protein